MAEAENTDGEDPYLFNLNIKPARHISRESQLETKGKDMRKRGFNKLRIVVIETVFGTDLMRGSGILCPAVKDWSEFGEEVDEFETGYDYQWILTAAHCVCTQKRSTCRMPERMRIRIPKYKMWPSKKIKTFQPGRREALESKRFEDIQYDADQIEKYVHVYEPYLQYFGTGSKLGEDFALIQIPVHKSTLPPNTFQVWNTTVRPDGFSITGFPAEEDKAYIPYFDRRKEEFSEFEVSPRDPGHAQMYYTSETSGGQSGGPVQFSNLNDNYRAVVGVHVTGKDTNDGEASGCMITKKISGWVDEIQKNPVGMGNTQDVLTSTSPKKVPQERQQESIPQVVKEEEVQAKKNVPKKKVEEVGEKVQWSLVSIFPPGTNLRVRNSSEVNLINGRVFKRSGKLHFNNDKGGRATLSEDGTVECSGEFKWGGDAGAKQKFLVGVECLAMSQGAFAAWKRDGTVVTWGHSAYGGDAGSQQSKLTDVVSITGALRAFAARTRHNTVITWGAESWGGDPGSKQSQLTDVEYVTAAYYAFAAKKHDGTVIAWGDREDGGDTGSKQSDLVDVEFLLSGSHAFAALKRDGSVIVWGSANKGGDPGSKQSDLVDIVSIGSFHQAFAAMKSDGRIICWGSSVYINDAMADCKRRHASKKN